MRMEGVSERGDVKKDCEGEGEDEEKKKDEVGRPDLYVMALLGTQQNT